MSGQKILQFSSSTRLDGLTMWWWSTLMTLPPWSRVICLTDYRWSLNWCNQCHREIKTREGLVATMSRNADRCQTLWRRPLNPPLVSWLQQISAIFINKLSCERAATGYWKVGNSYHAKDRERRSFNKKFSQRLIVKILLGIKTTMVLFFGGWLWHLQAI